MAIALAVIALGIVVVFWAIWSAERGGASGGGLPGLLRVGILLVGCLAVYIVLVANKP